MTFKLYFLILLSCLIFACSNNFYVNRENIRKDYEGEINYLGKNNTARITLTDNKTFKVEKIVLTEKKLIYFQEGSTDSLELTLHQINAITFNDHFVGFAYGASSGFVVSALMGGVIVGYSTDMSGMGVLAIAGSGLIVGGLYGGISGSNRNYVLISDE